MTDSRPDGADHLGQVVLTDSGNYRFCSAFLAEMSQQSCLGAFAVEHLAHHSR
jgi:hypothetical protein